MSEQLDFGWNSKICHRGGVDFKWDGPIWPEFHCLDYVYSVYRSASLAHVNSMLREQLDQATLANQQLTQDATRLTGDLGKAREEIESRESEWREEEKVKKMPNFLILHLSSA